jgi:hypothetical protein
MGSREKFGQRLSSIASLCALYVVNSTSTTSPITVYAQNGNVIQGCYSNATGTLRRVNSPSDCKNAETSISWNVAGPQGPQGLQGPPGSSGAASLRVIDSQGKEIGVFETRNVIVHVANINRWISLEVAKNGFVQSGMGFYYQSSDCSGPAQPSVDLGDDFNALVSAGLLDGGNVYYTTGPSQFFAWNSQKSNNTCFSNVGSGNVTPFATFPLSDLGATPLLHC